MTINSDSVSEILEAIRNWVDQLADGQFEKAAHDVTYLESPISPTDLKEAIGMYNPDYRDAPERAKADHFPEIDKPRSLDPLGEFLDLHYHPDELLIEYILPLDGEWSDLTARFSLQCRQGCFELCLRDIEVM